MVALVAMAGPLSGVADAHATLIASTPANDEVVPGAPERVELTFDQPVAVDTGGVTVLDPEGGRVDRGAPDSGAGGKEVAQDVDRGPAGTYTVSYRVLSDDGHVITGSFVYHVERRTGSMTVETGGERLARVLGALGRWIALAGSLLVGGVLAMALVVDRGGDGGWTGGLEASRRLLLPGAAATLFGTGLALLGSAADLSGRAVAESLPTVPDLVGSGRAGLVAGLRVAVALVLLVAVAGGPLLRRVPVLAGVAVLATLALPSFGGHASTVSPAALAVSSDIVHVLAAAAWVGALGVLALTWDGSRARAVRFSALAVVAAPVTIVTGMLNAWLQEGSLPALVETSHGRLVLAKAAGAGVMLAMGLVHRRWLADTARSLVGFARGLRMEALIGVAVLALTAVLVATPPGRETVSDPVKLVRQAGDTTVRIDVAPARSGPNEVHLYYLSRDGSLASVDAAELLVSSGEVEPRKVPLTPVTASHSVANGVQLTPGTWTFQVTIVSRGNPATTDFEVPIR